MHRDCNLQTGAGGLLPLHDRLYLCRLSDLLCGHLLHGHQPVQRLSQLFLRPEQQSVHFHADHPHPHHALYGGGPAQQDRPAAADQSHQHHQSGAGQVLRHADGAGPALPGVLPLPPDHSGQRQRHPGLGLCLHSDVLPDGQRLCGGGAAGVLPHREPGHCRPSAPLAPCCCCCSGSP